MQCILSKGHSILFEAQKKGGNITVHKFKDTMQ